jgi:alpha-methylacyl-CoA racemase
MSGPLTGIRIIEAGGIGPGPFAAMMLADMGAEVLRIDEPLAARDTSEPRLPTDLLFRGRRSVTIDLKHPDGLKVLLRLVAKADGLIEGFRPNVAERLGFGPDVCLERNRRLVYGRITGWGRLGPLSAAAGHDINYIALAGVLAHMGRSDNPPVPPLNLVGDFAGGGMLLSYGIVCALLETARSGVCQVVDTAMVDGAALLMTFMFGRQASGRWAESPEENSLAGYAPFYGVYATSDDRFIAVGATEPKFWEELIHRLGLSVEDFPDRMNPSEWPKYRDRLASIFRTNTRDHWCTLLEGTDACFAPVLTMSEAPMHPHHRQRNTFIDVDGVIQPAVAPRFSRTIPSLPSAPAQRGEHTMDALVDWGFDPTEVISLERLRIIEREVP